MYTRVGLRSQDTVTSHRRGVYIHCVWARQNKMEKKEDTVRLISSKFISEAGTQ